MILSSSSETYYDPYIVLFVFFGIIAFVIAIIIFFVVFNSVRNKRVKLASQYIQDIKNLNDKYTFYKFSGEKDTKNYYLSSKRAFDSFDFNKRTSDFVKENLSYFQQITERILYNRVLLEKYKKDIYSLSLTEDETLAKSNKMSLKEFNRREKKLGSKIVQNPQTEYCLDVEWEYTSPAGRNHYSNHRICSFENIRFLIQQHLAVKKKQFDPMSYTPKKPTEPRPQPVPRPQPRPQNNQKVYTSDDIDDIE